MQPIHHPHRSSSSSPPPPHPSPCFSSSLLSSFPSSSSQSSILTSPSWRRMIGMPTPRFPVTDMATATTAAGLQVKTEASVEASRAGGCGEVRRAASHHHPGRVLPVLFPIVLLSKQREREPRLPGALCCCFGSCSRGGGEKVRCKMLKHGVGVVRRGVREKHPPPPPLPGDTTPVINHSQQATSSVFCHPSCFSSW